jgi:DNA invertase Pin-like site-specific DNA recombinase
MTAIPAQQRLLREYAIKQGFTVVREFVDVETAKQAGRPEFAAMLGYLKNHRATCATIPRYRSYPALTCRFPFG